MKWQVQQGGTLVDAGFGPPVLVDRRLPWAPSDIGIDLSNPGIKTLAAGDNFIAGSEFAATTDWVLDAGLVEQNATIDCGGKRVFMPGFEVAIDFDPTTDYAKAITGRRALLMQNFAALHCEGFVLHGSTISDGINLNTTVAGAKAQLQNFRIEGLRENYRDTGTAAALITTTGQAQYNHPDVIQSYGGPSLLRVSHFYASSDRSFFTLASAGGPNFTEITVQKGHYKQLTHPVLGDQRTYPFYWDQAAGELNTFPLAFSEVYYEHGNGSRGAGSAFFPDGDARYLANVVAGGIIEGAPPETVFFVPDLADLAAGYSSPGYLP